MPIYMDRHDVSETVTAENVAELHQKDLKIQDQFGCRGLTYWFDEKRKTAFCLIEAPDAKDIQKMHNQAHGQVPHSVIEVDARIVELHTTVPLGPDTDRSKLLRQMERLPCCDRQRRSTFEKKRCSSRNPACERGSGAAS